MIDATEPIDGACHCGSVRFRVKFDGGFESARRCDCTYCRMKGAVAVTAAVGDLAILAGADGLTLYQFKAKVAKHYFCACCGIHTHHQRRSNPNQYGINVACLAGVNPFDFSEVNVNDGVNHPTDGTSSRVVGVLKFIASS